jgi:adenosylcobinamide kinase/adenosylcobinamide-phosphate guanylyltransferase
LRTLVLGGARSGKSAHGEHLVLDGLPGDATAIYLATAEARDDEMAQRIARHRARRDPRWRTIEEPIDLARALRMEAADRPVLIDCLTLWLANLLLAERDIARARAGLLAALGERSAPVVMVANEVGMSIVPDNALARRFRDEAGWLNQAVAAACERVVFVAAGLPLVLKDRMAVMS